jgi:hypothetical protein
MTKRIFLILIFSLIILNSKMHGQSPTITSFSPSDGAVGTLITIVGTNLTGITAFTIGGSMAIMVSDTLDQLVGLVMPGAITGTISITTTGGNAISNGNFIVTETAYPFMQQGSKLIGSEAIGSANQGSSVSISSDGNTAIVGGDIDNNNLGAAWIYTRSGGVWTQQGSKLEGTGTAGNEFQGVSVAISSDGNTAIVGGTADNVFTGAAWVYSRSGGVWSQQGNKLTGTGSIGLANVGVAVSISSDGNTAIVGGDYDNNNIGAAWVYTRSDGIWTQQGNKLVGSGAAGTAYQGSSVCISSDGNTAIVGGEADSNFIGAAWIYSRSGGIWTQQGNKLVGTGAKGLAYQGVSVSLSSDGNTAIVGGDADSNGVGAAWVYTRSSGVWTQQGSKLTGSGAVGSANIGISVSVSSDGNTAIIGGDYDNNKTGAVWVYTRSDGVWTQQGNKLIGSGATGAAYQGVSVSLSSDGSTAILGGFSDASSAGAAWIFVPATITGLDDRIKTNPELTIYPNPTTGIFTIQSNSTDMQLLKIVDMNGQLILSQNIFSNSTINTNELSQGIYDISLTNKENVVNKRLVIIH